MGLDENILVINKNILYKKINYEDNNNNFLNIEKELMINLINEYGFFKLRRDAEYDRSVKQIIPYIVITDLEQRYILVSYRLNKSGEERLHNLYSLGIGGHISDIDCNITQQGDNKEDLYTAYLNGLYRELYEEIYSSDKFISMEYRGIINSDKIEVDRHHIGMLYLIRFADLSTLKTNEPDKIKIDFMEIKTLKQIYPHMENWSRIVYDNCIK